MRSTIFLAVSISLIQIIARQGLCALEHTSVLKLTLQLWNSVWSGNFPKFISGVGQPRGLVMPLWESPNTRSMVARHRHRTISIVSDFHLSLKNKALVLLAMVLRSHFSLFYLSHSFSRCCQISWIIAYFARISSSSRLGGENASRNTRICTCVSDSRLGLLLELERTRGLIKNVGSAWTAWWINIMELLLIFVEVQLFLQFSNLIPYWTHRSVILSRWPLSVWLLQLSSLGFKLTLWVIWCLFWISLWRDFHIILSWI